MGLGKLGCGTRCAKILLFIFNFIFWVTGAVLLGLGIWGFVDQSSLTENLSKIITIADTTISVSLKTTAILFMVIGAFVFLVGFSGCCGAIRESRLLLGIYIVLLVLVIICEVVAGILAVVYRGRLEDKISNESVKYLNSDYKVDQSERDLAWNFLMQNFDCCGIAGPNDFGANPSNNVTAYCCVSHDGKPAESSITPKDWTICDNEISVCKSGGRCENTDFTYLQGCLKSLKDYVQEHYIIFTAIALVIAALELFGLLMAVCLCRALGQEEKHY